MSRKTIVISGGTLEEGFVLEVLKNTEHTYLIGVDRGNAFLYEHGCCPTHIVGDFDSLSPEIVKYYQTKTTIPIREFDPVKDASDTEMAVRLALELKSDEILLLGATGTRMDHVWANIQVLFVAKEANVKMEILDPYNRICIISEETHLTKENAYGDFFSVFPLGGTVPHFSIQGAKYPLTDHTLTPYDSLCVSNEIKADEVVITFPKGNVILMETRENY